MITCYAQHTHMWTHTHTHRHELRLNDSVNVAYFRAFFSHSLPFPSGKDLHHTADHWLGRYTALINETSALKVDVRHSRVCWEWWECQTVVASICFCGWGQWRWWTVNGAYKWTATHRENRPTLDVYDTGTALCETAVLSKYSWYVCMW